MIREVRDMLWPRSRRPHPAPVDENPNQTEVSILLIELAEMRGARERGAVVHGFMPGRPALESISASTSCIAVGPIAVTPWNGIPS